MKTLCALLFVLFVAVPVSAQIVNPQTLEFPASADHAATFGAQPLVTKYEALVVRQSATGSVLYVTDLGKPTPNTSNVITVPMPLAGVGGAAPNNTVLLVAIRTVGAPGTTPTTSVWSDPFGIVGPPAATGKPIPKP